jgi:diacylglycerol kinase family enzyme
MSMDAADKIDFVINRKAGTVLAEGEEEVVRSLKEIFGERAGEFYLVDGNEVAANVRQWVGRNRGGGRGLIVGGGDGTIMTAVSELKGTGITLGFLPLGTQNFLARKMGFSPDYHEAAHQFLTAKTRMLDVGSVNGRDFMIGGVFDDYSVRFFEAREDLREKKFLSFIGKAFAFAAGVLWGAKNTLMVGTREDELEEQVGRLFAVTANAIVPRSSAGLAPVPANFTTIAGNAFGTGPEPDGQLVFYGSPAGITRAGGIFSDIWDGTWDRGRHVNVVKGTELVVAAPEGKTGKKRIVLDGEILDLDMPMKFTIQPQALRAYTPG